MARAMEVRVLAVDVSQAMGADLAIAKRALMSLAQQKIIEMGSKTKMGLVLMGSTETKHEILDENNEMSEGWDNVKMARGIEQTDILHMEAINNLETEEAECSYLSGLMVAVDMLKKIEAKGKPDRGVVLVTNGRSPYDAEKDQLYIDLIRVKCQEDGISISVYGMNWHQDEAEWSASETMLHDLVKETQGKMTIVQNEAGFQSAAIKSVNPVTLYRGDLEFTPGLRIKVWAYPATKMQSLPSLKKRTKAANGAAGGEMGGAIQIDRKNVLTEDPDTEVPAEDITKAFKYGKNYFPLDDTQISAMKFEAAKTMKLIGTVKRDQILQHYLMSNADVVVPDKDQVALDGPSGPMLSALAQALFELEMVAVVSWVKRASSPPKLYGLFPYINEEDRVHGFHACQLPFSEDLRPQQLSSLSNLGKEPTNEQLDNVRAIVEDATLLDGCGDLTLQTSSIPNPAIQNFHRTILSKAIKMQQDNGASGHRSRDILSPLKPDPSKFKPARVSEANQLFKVEWIKPEVKREREEGAAEAAGDDAGKETKRPRIDSTEVAVKTEVKEEDSLDIGNVAKAFGDGAEGSDAIAKFERLWAEDPDEAIPEMKARIEELVDKSTDDRPLVKAVGLLEKLRDYCDKGRSDEPKQFNTVWEELDRKYRNHSAIKFWDKVLAKGAELGRLAIDGDEDPQSLSQPADEPPPAEDGAGLGIDDDEFD